MLQVPLAIVQFLVQVTIGNGAFLEIMRFSSRAPTLRPGQNIFDVIPLGQLLTFSDDVLRGPRGPRPPECERPSWRRRDPLRERRDLAARVDKRRPIRYGARP